MSDTQGSQPRLGAIIMANGGPDKLAKGLGVPHKALIEIEGRPMIMHAWQALADCPDVERVVVSCARGGPVARALAGQAELAESDGGDFADGIATGFGALGSPERALLVTCDIPLLTPAATSAFAAHVMQTPETDIHYAMVDIGLVRRAYPGTHRTAVRLRDGAYTAAGISAVSRLFIENSRARLMAAFEARKSKVAMAGLLGWGFLARFAMGTLAVADIERRCRELLDCQARAYALPYPECGFDVDSPRDLAAIREIMARARA